MKWLSTTIIVYMLAALTWWSILLMKQNDTICKMQVDQGTLSPSQAQTYLVKRRSMVIGEGVVFASLLMTGIFLLYGFYKRDLKTTKNQNNFLLAFSHELKSPITSINLTLDTLKKRPLDEVTKNELCNNALNESKRLEKIINSILMVTKIDDFKLLYEPIELISEVQSIVTTFNMSMENNGKITFLHDDENYTLEADKIGIQSLIINLVENALKYGDNKPIEIKLSKENNRVVLTVADQGTGIKDEEKKKIFDRFYRIGDESTRTSKGVGLGLYIVKKIVELHGGNISVSDNKPKGTLFKIKFSTAK